MWPKRLETVQTISQVLGHREAIHTNVRCNAFFGLARRVHKRTARKRAGIHISSASWCCRTRTTQGVPRSWRTQCIITSIPLNYCDPPFSSSLLRAMSTAAAAAMPDLTGCTVDGRFRLTRMLGSGTYGVVYEAFDTHASSLGAPAARAIKITRKADRKKHELAAARREIALHGLVSNHPNVVTVHDAYEDDNYFYLVMDFCTGGDLFEPICRQAYVGNDALVRKAFLSLIDAVEACHSLRIYHRDLKPENILVSGDRSQVFLADFGLATNQPIVQEFYCGTAAYMSPGEHF